VGCSANGRRRRCATLKQNACFSRLLYKSDSKCELTYLLCSKKVIIKFRNTNEVLSVYLQIAMPKKIAMTMYAGKELQKGVAATATVLTTKQMLFISRASTLGKSAT